MQDENQLVNPAPPGPDLTPPTAPTVAAGGGTVDPIAPATPPPAVGGVSGNTSGQGSGAIVPEEVKGWSWGGFFLTWIWGIGNGVWLALLTFVPFVGWVMPFVLGAKGREWAWQAKHWDSVEQFNKTQRTWGIIGLILAIIGIIFTVLWGSAVFNASTSGTTTTY